MCEVSELTVLVVDSDDDSLHEVCDILKEAGLTRLLCAPDAESALLWLTPDKYSDIDIIMVSNKVRQMNPLLFIHHARALCPDKQILMYSNCRKPTAHLAALTVGATDYLDKDDNFRETALEKLSYWISVTQTQVKIRGCGCGG